MQYEGRVVSAQLCLQPPLVRKLACPDIIYHLARHISQPFAAPEWWKVDECAWAYDSNSSSGKAAACSARDLSSAAHARLQLSKLVAGSTLCQPLIAPVGKGGEAIRGHT